MFEFEIEIIVSHCEIFLFYPANLFKESYEIVLSFESSGVHLSLICKKRPEQKANGAKQGDFMTTYQNIEKSLAIFSKEYDMRWVTLWLSFFSGTNRRASCLLSRHLTETMYLFVNTFTLNGLFSAEFHNKNTRKDSSNLLDSNREKVAFTVFQWTQYR